MNKYQLAKLKSNQLVVKEAESNVETVNLIPKFAAGMKRLKGINTDVEVIRILQERDTSGVTTEKNISMGNLVEWTIDIAGGVHSYADEKNDIKLRNQVNFTQTEIEHLGYVDLIKVSRSIVGLAKALPASDLELEGITSDELTEYENAINAFDEIKTAPREASIDKSNYTDKLASLFAEANALLKNSLDRLATQFKRKDPGFYLKYKAARVLSLSSARKDSDTETNSTTAGTV